MTANQSSWIVAIIQLSSFLVSLPIGLYVNKCGRKPLLLATSPLFALSWLLVIYTRSVPMLYLSRFIQGIGMTIVNIVLPLYLVEIPETRVRGIIGNYFQFLQAVGILYTYAIGPYVSYQVLAYACFVLPIVFFFAFVAMPESPYYLLMIGCHAEAEESLVWLRDRDSQEISKELEDMESFVNLDIKCELSASLWDLVSTPQARKASIITQVLTITAFLPGCDAVIAYVTDTFASIKEGDSAIHAYEFTIVLGVAIVLASVVTSSIVDRSGRRFLITTSWVGGFCTAIATGVYYFMNNYSSVDVGPYDWISCSTIVGYVIFVCVGLVPLAITVRSEIFPSKTRGLAGSVATFSDALVSFISMRMYGIIEITAGVYLNYFLYSIILLFGGVTLYKIMPETKGKTFHEIQVELSGQKDVETVLFPKT